MVSSTRQILSHYGIIRDKICLWSEFFRYFYIIYCLREIKMAEVHLARISDNGDSTSNGQFRSGEINGPGTEVSQNDEPSEEVKSKPLKCCASEEDTKSYNDGTTENDGNILVNGCITDNNQDCANESTAMTDVNSAEHIDELHRVEEGIGRVTDMEGRVGELEQGGKFQHSTSEQNQNDEHSAVRTTAQHNEAARDVDVVAEDMSGLSLDEASTSKSNVLGDSDEKTGIAYVGYESEKQMPDIMRLITKDLSEPYSIYTYRYFIHNWPDLCFLAMDKDKCVGAIVCKLDVHKKMAKRGYIAMLAVDENYRRKHIGSSLVRRAIYAMINGNCDEVVLETEITNKAALQLYENLGFVRDKRLFRYYLNGVDALRLKLWLR
ncbi:N-alpha-acetyltransferase 30-like [Ptychodera flava]|uniref:N-alpha-acetyltransferase 30-like n=1 Tax=Ptychodera flava TaxID=63121 RepID=UPI003969E569